MRIMLVEDNDIFRETFKEELLGRLPSTIVKEAANGEEVIQKLKGFTPQIIFMDLNLPGESGFQLTQKIKAQFPNVRIALLTSFDFPECRQAAVQYGADTDAHPYRKGSYTTWELSVDRANAVRKELASTGIPGDRIMKVIGYAATDPIVRDDPYSPLNRRVSIVVKEENDTEIDVNPVPQPGVASTSSEEGSASNPEESLPGVPVSGDASGEKGAQSE